MPQFGGVLPDNVDLSQFEGIPGYLKNKQSLLSDHNPERDKKLIVRFFSDSYFESKLTEERGYPVFSTRDFIGVQADSKSEFVQMIKFDQHGKPYANVAKWLSRFPRHWEEYQKGRQEGYPIEQLPGADKGLVATLKMVGVKTAEGLVQLEGEIFDRIEGLAEFKSKAQKFLDGQDLLIGEVEKRKALEAELAVYKKELKKATKK